MDDHVVKDRASATLWTAADAAAADRFTFNELGIPSSTLMERAALAVAHEIVALRGIEPLDVVCLVGPGNNGADALAVARILSGWGVRAVVSLATSSRNPAAVAQLVAVEAGAVPVYEGRPANLPRRAIVVDGLLGTGAQGALREEIRRALQWQRDISGPRVAIDVPTGIDIDSGGVGDVAFRADLTVTFGCSKPGLHVTPGRSYAGRIVVADIGLSAPPTFVPSRWLVDPLAVAKHVRSLPEGTHKGQRGHVAIVGGGRGTPGAAVLAGTAAMRGGAGMCTVITSSAEVREQLIAYRPELMLAVWDLGVSLLPSAKALVVGPGLTDPDLDDRLATLFDMDPRPSLWDASGLDHIPFGGFPAAPRILTPHPGEAARLLGRADASETWTPARVQSDRMGSALRLAERTGAIVVLKGEGTVVATPDARIFIAVTGGAPLATAGSGDCLAGLGGALLARGLEALHSACVAVHVHGLAGDYAAARHPGPLALDVADGIGEALQVAALDGDPSGWPGFRRG